MFHVKHSVKQGCFDPFPRLRYKPASEAKMQARFDQKIDVVVIGGGHAGCEAVAAAARMGRRRPW
jgi:hypothetical protein